jgi:hypothetical protein
MIYGLFCDLSRLSTVLLSSVIYMNAVKRGLELESPFLLKGKEPIRDFISFRIGHSLLL